MMILQALIFERMTWQTVQQSLHQRSSQLPYTIAAEAFTHLGHFKEQLLSSFDLVQYSQEIDVSPQSAEAHV
jgi:hypothetical protein